MSVQQALRTLFGSDTQAQIAERLTARGIPTDQTKVSRWLRGQTVPRADELATIEWAYDKPAGWVLATAGFVDIAALVALSTPRSGDGPIDEQRTRLASGMMAETAQQVIRANRQAQLAEAQAGRIAELASDIEQLRVQLAEVKSQLARLFPLEGEAQT